MSRLSLARFPTHIHRALHRNVYLVTTLAWSKRLYYNTIAQPPARIVVGGSTWKDAAGWERPPWSRRRLDRRGDAAESPERRVVAVGSLSRGDGASTAVVRRNVIRLQLQLQLVSSRRCVGGRVDGSLRITAHVWATKIATTPATRRKLSSRPWLVMHGASLFASDSLGPSAPLIGCVISTANAVLRHL